MPLVFIDRKNGRRIDPHQSDCLWRDCPGCAEGGRWIWADEKPTVGSPEHRCADAIQKISWQAWHAYEDQQSIEVEDYPILLEGLTDVLVLACQAFSDARKDDIEARGKRVILPRGAGSDARRRIAVDNARAIIKQAICQASRGIDPYKAERGEDR